MTDSVPVWLPSGIGVAKGCSIRARANAPCPYAPAGRAAKAPSLQLFEDRTATSIAYQNSSLVNVLE